MTVAEKLCDRFGILVKGSIRDMGTLRQILDRHSTDSLEEVFFGYVLPEEGEEAVHA